MAEMSSEEYRIIEDKANDLKKLADKAKARVDAMSPEEQQRHWDAQKQSFVRGMTTPCEHGMLDFEDCEQCRNLVRNHTVHGRTVHDVPVINWETGNGDK